MKTLSILLQYTYTVCMSVTKYLETAVLFPQHHDELISYALEQLLICVPAVGTALIWPCQKRKVPWRVYCAGSKRNTIQDWLSVRLDLSLDTTIGVLEHDLIRSFSDLPPPLLMRLGTLPSSTCGLWIVWMAPSVSVPSGTVLKGIERVRLTLEAALEVESKEADYFSASSPLYDRNLIEALTHDDAHALSAFLSLTRVIAKADLAYWARAYDDTVEVTGHLGAKHSGFGFALPRGHGMGGRVAVYGKPMQISDYRNSPYRDPGVCDIVDSEQIRSGIALPVCHYIAPEKRTPVSAVLYATRRTVTPFSLAERLLLQRQAGLLGQLALEVRPSSFFFPSAQHLPDHRAVWHNLVLHANRIEEVEAWASQLIKGAVIVTDTEGNPYVVTHSEQLEHIRASGSNSSQPGMAQVLSLAAPGVDLPGQIYLCPSIPLPPRQWPDFFADLIMACNVVITRMEQRQNQLDHQREQWLHVLFKEKPSQSVEQIGYRLGLPIRHGQLWVLAWPHQTILATKSVRKRVIAESVVLDKLKSPLTFFDDDMAVVLLEEQASQTPSKVRDALLKHCGAHPLWIVHGGRYHTFQELKMTLTHMISLAQKARREGDAEYLLDICTLDSLLENPKLTEDLDLFARKLLTPLIEYDATSSSHLTETFVLARTLGSAQAVADQLGVHVNTIRYRLRRAEEILSIDQTSPKELMAMEFAAFIWQRFGTSEQKPS